MVSLDLFAKQDALTCGADSISVFSALYNLFQINTNQGTKQMNIKPLGDYVVVEMIKSESYSPGGIALPPDYQDTQLRRAKVIAVGPGFRNAKGELTPVDVSVDSEVLINGYDSSFIEVDGKTFHLVSNRNIIAILE